MNGEAMPAPVQEPVVPVQTGEGAGATPPAGGEPTPSTFKLPDGRELPGDKVVEEYNKLLGDYTQKSQRLSELEKPTQTPDGTEDRWRNPEYKPQTWDEVLGEAERRALARIEARDQERTAQTQKEQQQRDVVNKQIDDAVVKIKETDKELDEKDMFAYAAEQAKQGVQYSTVDGLYSHYKEVQQARRSGEANAMRNMANRNAVNVGVGKAGPSTPGPVDLGQLRRHSSILDAVYDDLSRRK